MGEIEENISIEMLNYRSLLTAMLRNAALDVHCKNRIRRENAVEWIKSNEEYEFSFHWVVSQLRGYVVYDSEMAKLKINMLSKGLIKPNTKSRYQVNACRKGHGYKTKKLKRFK